MSYQQMQDYKRRKLVTLIREVDQMWGGDDEEFLNEYIAEVLHTWENDIDKALICFTDLHKQAIDLGKRL